MVVTDVRIRRLTWQGRMRAIVSITLNDKFAIHDIRIIDGRRGLFVAMPSKRNSGGEFRDIAHPINAEARRELQEAILKAYTAKLEENYIVV